MKFPKWLKNIKTLAITCWQFGDTGKGKFVDMFAQWADIIARGTGADNAGHTICFGEEKHIMHLIPSGILHDKDGKVNVIGSGVAVNPRVLLEEIELLHTNGFSTDHLMIALNAKLILPQHILLDRLREGGSTAKIGTTGRGVGPVYADHYARVGLTVNDMLNPAVFRRKLQKNLQEKLVLIHQYEPGAVKVIMAHEHLQFGLFYGSNDYPFNEDEIVTYYCECGQKLRRMILDTDTFIRQSVGKKNILLEGAQGLMLSVDNGSYPFVTSSDCTIAGLAKGVGLDVSNVDLELGINKAFYMTRVGGGPFPTEMGGQKSESWCATAGITQAVEKEKYGAITVNSVDDFLQGVGVRIAGAEYGATTGRPRRCGWLDLPIMRHARNTTGHQDVILTKLDVLDGCEVIRICDSYIYRGQSYEYGCITLEDGDEIKVAIPDIEIMKHCQPVYIEFAGWLKSIREIRDAMQLPPELLRIILFIEEGVGVKVRIVSVGPDREETIFM